MKRSVKTGLVAAAVLTAAGGWMLANEMAPRSVGLPIGTRAPDFALVDQRGQTRDLDSLLARGKLALVFYRSADW
jgi:cytochrome oxidase Cu insertion factor (SCO1/SenC/PrrC family)